MSQEFSLDQKKTTFLVASYRADSGLSPVISHACVRIGVSLGSVLSESSRVPSSFEQAIENNIVLSKRAVE